jgi:uncharacterized protein YndB with AHSA1/START domain
MIKVKVSTIIDAPLSLVWAMASDFNGLPNWHPAADESVIEEGKANNEVGCIRNFALKDGSGHVRETLLSLSSINHEIIYDMIGGPLPFVNYIATMHFQPVTDRDTTFACWLAEFTVSDGKSDYWEKFVANDVFLEGFRALEQAVKSKA